MATKAKTLTAKCSEENIFDYVSHPNDCPCCKGKGTVILLSRDKFGGDWGYNKMAYKCVECDAMVGADNTGVAMGVLGNSKTRALRKKAHEYFDRLWKNGRYKTRTAAYKALARLIDIEYEDCHFANMNEYTLTIVINMLKENKI